MMNKCPLLLSPLFILTLPPLAYAASTPEAATQLTPINVHGTINDAKAEGSSTTGYRYSGAELGPLGKTPLKETPYSLHVTSGELIENRNAHTESEALKTNPSVSTLMEPGGYSTLSRVMIRGFTAADQGELRDGMVDRSFTFPPLENVDRIEVLNGLSSFLYGFSAIGGSINYVSKAPTPESFGSVASGTYGGGINYLHGDAGGPMDANGLLKYRTNLYRESGSTYTDGGSQQRTLISGVVSVEPTTFSKVSFDYWHQDYDQRSLLTYINVNPAKGIMVPSASRFDANRQYGQSWTFNRSRKDLLGVSASSELGHYAALRGGYRYGDMWREYNLVGATLSDNAGHYSESYTATPRQTETTHSYYALVDANLPTGPVMHQLTTGFTGTQFEYTRGLDVKRALGNSSIDDPSYFADPAAPLGGTTTVQGNTMSNWLVGDRLLLPYNFSALVGVNHAKIDQYSRGVATNSMTTTYTQSKNTPSLALLYTPWQPVTTYLSYMEGLSAGGTAPATYTNYNTGKSNQTVANANQMLEPSASKQYEVGAKSRFGGMDLDVALFQIDKINEYVDPADSVYKQDGRQQHRGLEISSTGKLTDDWLLTGGVTWLDATMKEVSVNKALEGKTPTNVPNRQAKLYGEYTLPMDRRFTLVGGVNYFGSRYVDDLNTDDTGSGTTFDAGVRFAPVKPVQLNLTVNNLFDKAYWSYYRSGDGLLLGAPRIVSFTAKASF